MMMKRDFSLRKPTGLQEQTGKRASACSARNDRRGGRRVHCSSVRDDGETCVDRFAERGREISHCAAQPPRKSEAGRKALGCSVRNDERGGSWARSARWRRDFSENILEGRREISRYASRPVRRTKPGRERR